MPSSLPLSFQALAAQALAILVHGNHASQDAASTLGAVPLISDLLAGPSVDLDPRAESVGDGRKERPAASGAAGASEEAGVAAADERAAPSSFPAADAPHRMALLRSLMLLLGSLVEFNDTSRQLVR